MSTSYRITVRLVAGSIPVSRPLRRIIKRNGLMHPDGRWAMQAARNIARDGGREVEMVIIEKVRTEPYRRLPGDGAIPGVS